MRWCLLIWQNSLQDAAGPAALVLALALLDSFGKLSLKYWMGHFTLPSIKPGSASVSTARTRLSVLYQSFSTFD